MVPTPIMLIALHPQVSRTRGHSIATAADLAGLRSGALAGNNYALAWLAAQDLDPAPMPDYSSGYRTVLAGRLDVFWVEAVTHRMIATRMSALLSAFPKRSPPRWCGIYRLARRAADCRPAASASP